MTTDELTERTKDRLDRIRSVHESPSDYLDSIVDDLSKNVARLGPEGQAWVAGFIAGQIVAEDALTALAKELPDTVPEDWTKDNPESKGDANDGS